MAKHNQNSKKLGHDPFEDVDMDGVDDEDVDLPIEALGDDPFSGADLNNLPDLEEELFPLLASQEEAEEEEDLREAAEADELLTSLVARQETDVAFEKVRSEPLLKPADTSLLEQAIVSELRPLVDIPAPESQPAPVEADAVAEEEAPSKVQATFHFPTDFKWGVATAAHQVEGNNTNNDWWKWEWKEDTIKENHKSGLACNWWENAESDFDIAARMGVNALRLSVEWSRIEPRPGEIDESALQRYGNMLQALRARHIEPMVTLHHFSSPRWLAEMGGWENGQTVGRFAGFARLVVERLGKHCDLWCTVNEPNVYGYQGYLDGAFPPGKSDMRTAMRVIRHMLAGHAAAYKEIHTVQPHARVGLAHNMRIFDPADPHSWLDRQVARATDTVYNRAILTALTKGRWTLPLGFGLAWRLRRSLDWIGLNYYTRDLVTFDRSRSQELFGRRLHARNAELLDGGYGEFYAPGMFRCIRRLASLGLPIYITENGIPDDDDDQRPRYVLAHLHQVWRAIQLCYPVMGYYHWTLVDNFEWAEGWTLRFGLIALDPDSQVRVPRRSAHLYTDIIQAGAITSDMVTTYAPRLRPELLPE